MSQEKYAALIKRSQYIEGDERSKQNPGHGYGPHTLQYTEVREFKDEEEMLKWVEHQHKLSFPDTYKIIRYTEMEVKVTVNVSATVTPGVGAARR